MSIGFKREKRYIVFKLSDLGNSLKGDEIRRLAEEYAEQRSLKGKPPLECVIVEADWPEYEPTWKAIEDRVTGAQPAPSVPEGWLRAIDETLVVAHIGVANESDTYEEAKAKLDNLIGFHVDVATDPAVNGGWKLVPIETTPSVPDGFAWPECPKRRQSHVLFDDGYEEGWATCVATIKAALAAPEATWLPVPDKHPTFDPVDLQLADGSVLCGCVPQSDGDYWWEGPSGEVFIDPRYAPVTHWRLSAAPNERSESPEAKS